MMHNELGVLVQEAHVPLKRGVQARKELGVRALQDRIHVSNERDAGGG
jgi:hypothetical protein